MDLNIWTTELPLEFAFGISRGTTSKTRVVFVSIEQDGIEGLGETCPSSFYGHDADSVAEALRQLTPWLKQQDAEAWRSTLHEARDRLRGNRAALCALDCAFHDWAARKLDVPLHRMLGLRGGPLPRTTYTIGLDTIDVMVEKLKSKADHPVFKIKLGRGDEDLKIIEALRAETDAPFRVDANCAWTADETIEKSHALKDLGVEFIEQPMPRGRFEEMERVYRESALPLIADEDAELPEHIAQLPERYHGVCVKLVKCGGIAPAMRMLEQARELGLKTMMGCMIESSLLITAGAQIGSLLDYADLDSPLLLAEDPYEGVMYDDGQLILPNRPGLGVIEREPPAAD